MKKNYSYIYWIIIVLLAFQSAFAQNETAGDKIDKNSINSKDIRIENLKEQVSEYFETFNNNDADTFVELTNSKVFKKFGSRKKFLKVMKEYFESSTKDYYESLPTTVEDPTELFEINKNLYSVIPYKTEGLYISTKKKIANLYSVVGISSDNGKSWKFVNGAIFKELFPKAQYKINDPSDKHFVNGIEQ